jgi:hypothetical protein
MKKLSRIRVAIILLVDLMLIVAVFLLLQIDRIVHVTLYDYGLVFDLKWAEPYWIMHQTSLWLIIASTMIISVVEFVYYSYEDEKG